MDGTYLAFDFGTAFIGVAVGQTITRSAQPLEALKANKGEPQWEAITQLITNWQPKGLVVGVPFNMDGTEQWITEKAKTFAKQLEEHTHLPVYLIDERLTTVEAKQQLFDRGGFRALKKTKIDSLSACLILEDWFSSHI